MAIGYHHKKLSVMIVPFNGHVFVGMVLYVTGPAKTGHVGP